METQDSRSIQSDALSRITDGLPPNTVALELHRCFSQLNEARIARAVDGRVGRTMQLGDVQRILNGDAAPHLQRAIDDPEVGGPALGKAIGQAKANAATAPSVSRPRLV